MSGSVRRLAWRLGRNVYCRARGETASDDIVTNGESYVQRCVVRAAEPSLRFCAVDVGANQGDWSLPLVAALPPALRSRSASRLHAVEPVPTTQGSLKASLEAAGAADVVEVHALALSETSGRGSMQIVGGTSGRNSLVANEMAASGTIEVETMSLADFFERQAIERAQLVKIDAEGHDLAILKGARGLLAAGRIDVVQFEYNHTWVFSRSFLKDVFDLVEGLPYKVGRVRPRGVEVLDGWHPEIERFFHANYLLVREPALAWFDVHRGHFDASNTYA